MYVSRSKNLCENSTRPYTILIFQIPKHIPTKRVFQSTLQLARCHWVFVTVVYVVHKWHRFLACTLHVALDQLHRKSYFFPHRC